MENGLRHYVPTYWLTSILESPLAKETDWKLVFSFSFCYIFRNKWSYFEDKKHIIGESNLRYNQGKGIL